MSDLPHVDPQQQIEERLGELRPLVTEYHRLQAAREALVGLRGRRSAQRPDEDEAPGARDA